MVGVVGVSGVFRVVEDEDELDDGQGESVPNVKVRGGSGGDGACDQTILNELFPVRSQLNREMVVHFEIATGCEITTFNSRPR